MRIAMCDLRHAICEIFEQAVTYRTSNSLKSHIEQSQIG